MIEIRSDETRSAARPPGERGSEGFSLPELLTVIFLMGMFIVFGGPAMNEAYKAYEVRSTADNLVTDIRALRYNAVAQRAPQTMTIQNQSSVTSPNTYSFTNSKGNLVTMTLGGVNIEATSATTLTFNINGSTGATGNTTISVSIPINSGRSDRYTITVTPSGTVSSAYTTF